MTKRRNRKLTKLILLIAVIILAYYFASESPLVKNYVANPELLKNLILGFGILAPVAIILLQFFQTTISIIPSQITTIIAGFIFGPILGLVYSLIGAFLGSMFVFTLARKYGKKLALILFDKKDLQHFKILFKKRKLWTLFLARIAPLFPNDLVSFGAGLTDIKLRNFNLISSIGFIIQMIILTYFGSELATGKISLTLILISVIISLFFLIAVFEKQIKQFILDNIHLIEKEGSLIKRIMERKI